jgi:peptide/nickel transport system substrate-binding protein
MFTKGKSSFTRGAMAVLAGLMAISLLAACAGTPATPTAPEATATQATGAGETMAPSATSAPTTATTPQATGGLSMVIGVGDGSGQYTLNFNPFSPNRRMGVIYMYEPLYVVSTLNGKPVPFLGTDYSWKDSSTLVITTRDGVKWSDGQPFSADDVVFTFQYMKDHPEIDDAGIWQELDSVSAQGNQVTFKFKSADVPGFLKVSQIIIVPKHVWSSISNPAEVTNDKPVVTGPFVLGDFNPSQYTLKKNPTYWQAGKVAPDELVFPLFGGNETATLKMTSGEWDWGTIAINNIDQVYVAKDPHNKYFNPLGGAVSLVLNLKKAPFDDVAFRKAVASAIDRKRISDKAENGAPVASQTALVLPNEQDWLDPSIANQGYIETNVDQAKKTLQDAGYKTGSDGKLQGKDGKPISFTIQVPNGWTDWIQTCQFIQQDLAQLGIDVQVRTPEYSGYSDAMRNGSFDAALGGIGGSANVYLDYSPALDSTFSAAIGQPASSNFARWEDPATDQLLQQLRAATDAQTQKDLSYKLEAVMVNSLPYIPLFYGRNWGEYSTRKFTGWPDEQNPYAKPVPYLNDVLIVLTNLKPAQ